MNSDKSFINFPEKTEEYGSVEKTNVQLVVVLAALTAAEKPFIRHLDQTMANLVRCHYPYDFSWLSYLLLDGFDAEYCFYILGYARYAVSALEPCETPKPKMEGASMPLGSNGSEDEDCPKSPAMLNSLSDTRLVVGENDDDERIGPLVALGNDPRVEKKTGVVAEAMVSVDAINYLDLPSVEVEESDGRRSARWNESESVRSYDKRSIKHAQTLEEILDLMV